MFSILFDFILMSCLSYLTALFRKKSPFNLEMLGDAGYLRFLRFHRQSFRSNRSVSSSGDSATSFGNVGFSRHFLSSRKWRKNPTLLEFITEILLLSFGRGLPSTFPPFLIRVDDMDNR